MTEATYREAVNRAIAAELEADDDVFLLGEDVAAAGGVFKTTEGLQARFGAHRVLDTPISEQAIVGTAIGAAVQGLRPLAEIMFADFAGVCFDQIANQLAKYRYMTGGQVRLPVTIRLANGAGTGFAAQHSQPVENWFLNVPGLKLVTPATPADAYALLRAAIRDPDPVLFFEHKGLLNVKGPLGDAPGRAGPRRGRAPRRRRHRGRDPAHAPPRPRGRGRAGRGGDRGRADRPADAGAVRLRDRAARAWSAPTAWSSSRRRRSPAAGARRSRRLLTMEAFEALDAPPAVVGGDDTPIPYAGVLEDAWLPDVRRIAEAIRRTVAF